MSPILIFVFGSNLAGRHGKGAALAAVHHHGAVRGVGEGLQGRSYAIPTKDSSLRPLPLEQIEEHVNTFIQFAYQHPHWRFNITAVGCGLAGYEPAHIAPLFANVPANCELPPSFLAVLGRPDTPF